MGESPSLPGLTGFLAMVLIGLDAAALDHSRNAHDPRAQ